MKTTLYVHNIYTMSADSLWIMTATSIFNVPPGIYLFSQSKKHVTDNRTHFKSPKSCLGYYIL